MEMILESYQVVVNKTFTGRDYERDRFYKIDQLNEACILVVYGRRRVGKTELLEQSFCHRGLLKFEGIEKGDTDKQMFTVLSALAKYTGEPHLANLKFNSWLPIFELIAKFVAKGEWTVYFEEVQWLAEYKDEFISELKHAWDNQFRRNAKLRLILCGSSPSFMINKVLQSKALYNRSMHEIPLQEFNLAELQAFLPKRSMREIMDAYLTVGGMPEYLKRIKTAPSLFLGICENSFTRGGYFTNESDRIFVSSMADNRHYRQIVACLGTHRYVTRDELAQHIGMQSGGQLTSLLKDLIICGFIERYTPYNQKPNSILSRYCIKDAYLMFYFKFIEPIKSEILNGDFNNQPTIALDITSYHKWLGFGFERFCRRNHRMIASILGFSAVRYISGVFFNRRTSNADPGFQIDLVFQRADNVMTICEVRYLQDKADTELIESFERKLKLFEIPEKYSIQKVLITTEGATDALIGRAYFDRIITLSEISSMLAVTPNNREI